jgi:hypothetical protein
MFMKKLLLMSYRHIDLERENTGFYGVCLPFYRGEKTQGV